MKNRINYGIDAPKVILNLFVISGILLCLSVLLPEIKIGEINFNFHSFSLIGGTICFLEGIFMLGYAKFGKYRHRERILNLITWTGNETVLDVGTGLGLLMIGAAKKLTNGKSIGIDIWNQEDLSTNYAEFTKLNAEYEGVSNKIEIRNENILSTSFQENTFDVVLSNLCLHNIKNLEGRLQACREIHRILKQNGVAIISDFKSTNDYKNEFQNLGMPVNKIGTYYFDTFPPLTIIKVVKSDR